MIGECPLHPVYRLPVEADRGGRQRRRDGGRGQRTAQYPLQVDGTVNVHRPVAERGGIMEVKVRGGEGERQLATLVHAAVERDARRIHLQGDIVQLKPPARPPERRNRPIHRLPADKPVGECHRSVGPRIVKRTGQPHRPVNRAGHIQWHFCDVEQSLCRNAAGSQCEVEMLRRTPPDLARSFVESLAVAQHQSGRHEPGRAELHRSSRLVERKWAQPALPRIKAAGHDRRPHRAGEVSIQIRRASQPPPRSGEPAKRLQVHVRRHERQVQRSALSDCAGGVRDGGAAVSFEPVDVHDASPKPEHRVGVVDDHPRNISTSQAQPGLADDRTRRPGGGDESCGLTPEWNREQVERSDTPDVDALEVGQHEELPCW